MSTRSIAKFTKANLEALRPEDAPFELKDKAIDGLRIRVAPSGNKSLFVYRRIQGGDPVRVKLGSPSDYLNIKDIHGAAFDVIALLRQGINPNTERKERIEQEKRRKELESIQNLTLKSAFEDYILHADISHNTSKQFKITLNKHLVRWHKMPLADVVRHRELQKVRDSIFTGDPENPANTGSAKFSIAAISTVLTYVRGANPDESHLLPGWPLVGQAKKHFFKHCKVVNRRGYLEVNNLSTWWAATEKLAMMLSNSKRDGKLYRDYFRFLLLTGMRKDEARVKLRWGAVDFEENSLFLPTTKNKKPLRVPMSTFVREMLLNRHKDQNPNDLVFGYLDAQFGSDQIREITQGHTYVDDEGKKQTCIHKTPHELRHTFKTYADLAGVPEKYTKALMNHSQPQGSVSDRYSHAFYLDALRPHTQAVTDFVLGCLS